MPNIPFTFPYFYHSFTKPIYSTSPINTSHDPSLFFDTFSTRSRAHGASPLRKTLRFITRERRQRERTPRRGISYSLEISAYMHNTRQPPRASKFKHTTHTRRSKKETPGIIYGSAGAKKLQCTRARMYKRCSGAK